METLNIETPKDLAGIVIPAGKLVEIYDANDQMIAHRNVSRPVDQKATSWVTQFAEGYVFPFVIKFLDHEDAPAAPSQETEA